MIYFCTFAMTDKIFNQMKTIISGLILLLGIILMSCSQSQWFVVEMTGKKIPLDSQTNQIADPAINTMIQPFKLSLDTLMNEVIGFAPETMRGHAPESLLSNYCADIYRQTAADFMKRPIDIAIINMGGLRTSIPAGNVTIRKMYELMPFENELVIVWLRGTELITLLNRIASVGGEGLSGMSMVIKNGKADKILIGGEPLNPDFTYSIATNDYLAEGNDNMHELTQFDSKVKTKIKVRDMLTAFIKKETASGKKIESKMEGRITLQ
jgi:2',3'-cyclic-nucleotide 2'-phosphodiesterase (5'-nucleotidase family)